MVTPPPPRPTAPDPYMLADTDTMNLPSRIKESNHNKYYL